MTTLGTLNDLKVLRLESGGAWLDGSPEGPILLPLEQVPPTLEPGQVLRVFAYREDEGRLVAYRRPPMALGGEVCFLKVVSVNPAGAYLDWGLPKPLFMPWKEVKHEVRRLVKPGQKVLVFLFSDEAGHLAASTRLSDFLVDEADEFKEGDQVSLVIGDRTDIGVRVVVNHRYWGMVHDSDLFGKVSRGETRDGWVKAPRADRKLSLSLSAPGYAKVDAVAQALLDTLKRRGGFLPVTDKSAPEQIYTLFGISKKVFKQTLGALYKARRISIDADGIRLLKAP
ncbi:S1 RNA-binding domain-containing protein [Geothrix sp. PMB-07]|uniref:CvfB family protein n=1 Tax=Geothrix sp. PMB-07 TaxID=3068640 RepID=UPI0027411956|nr:S1-like domain-containing RNA-binding protein [Geothrix sp. PMB-07]WLT32950.1 S1-like domain-containing RNA-binding protein [Geothrix sp. PMB-07]